MAEFINLAEGQRLLGLFQQAVTPNKKPIAVSSLYERVTPTRETRGGYRYSDEMNRTLDVLVKDNGYFNGLDYQNAAQNFRGLMKDGKTDWVRESDAPTLAKFIFFVRRAEERGESGLMAQCIANGTMAAVMDRAMQLGSNNPAPQPALA